MRNRNKLSTMKKKYIKLPNKLLLLGLNSHSISIFTYMASVPEDFNPSVKTICKAVKLSAPTVIKYIKELMQHNVINKYAQGGSNTFTKYEFVNPENWR